MPKTYDRGKTDYDYAVFKAKEYYTQFKDILEFDELVNEIYIIMTKNRLLGRARTDNIPHWLDMVKGRYSQKIDVITIREDIEDYYDFNNKIYYEYMYSIISKYCNQKEQYILFKHYGLYDKALTFTQIGKLLNISKQRVKQIEDKALTKIKLNMGRWPSG